MDITRLYKKYGEIIQQMLNTSTNLINFSLQRRDTVSTLFEIHSHYEFRFVEDLAVFPRHRDVVKEAVRPRPSTWVRGETINEHRVFGTLPHAVFSTQRNQSKWASEWVSGRDANAITMRQWGPTRSAIATSHEKQPLHLHHKPAPTLLAALCCFPSRSIHGENFLQY